eukprot:374349-Pyramimonas_sp.AAC.1
MSPRASLLHLIEHTTCGERGGGVWGGMRGDVFEHKDAQAKLGPLTGLLRLRCGVQSHPYSSA